MKLGAGILQKQKLSQSQKISREQILQKKLLNASEKERDELLKKVIEDNGSLKIVKKIKSARFYEKNIDFSKIIEETVSTKKSLSNDLIFQLRTTPNLTEQEISLGEEIISYLDKDGYIKKDRTKDKYFLTLLRENKSEDFLEMVDKIVTLIQSFEPIGTCTLNPFETALYIAKNSDDVSNNIVDFLEFLVKEIKSEKDISKIDKSSKDFIETSAFMGRINLRPSSLYENESSVSLAQISLIVKNGKLVCKLLNSYTIEIDETKTSDANKIIEAKNIKSTLIYMEEKLEAIAKYVGNFQLAFLKTGNPTDKKILYQKKMANDLNMSESTISRLIYKIDIQTNFKVISLKDFFYKKEGVIKNEMEKIYKKYEQLGLKRPTDLKMTEILQANGENVSRRTIAKYRKKIEA